VFSLSQSTLLLARCPLMEGFIAYSVGYFFYDLLLMVLFPASFWSKGMFVHHFMGCTIIPQPLVQGKGLFLVAIFYFTEISTVFVNNRWMLEKLGYRNHGIYLVNGLVMTVVFFLVRLFPFQVIFIYKV
jgi:hypothetical protein